MEQENRISFTSYAEIEFEVHDNQPENSLLPESTTSYCARLIVDATDSTKDTVEIHFNIWPEDAEGDAPNGNTCLELNLGSFDRAQLKDTLSRLLNSIPCA